MRIAIESLSYSSGNTVIFNTSILYYNDIAVVYVTKTSSKRFEI